MHRSLTAIGQLVVLCALAAAPLHAVAQTTAPAPTTSPADAPVVRKDLPAAIAVLKQAIDAMGGRKSFEKVTSSMTKGVMIAPAGMGQIDMEMYAAEPNRFLVRRTIPGMGEISEGSDGVTTWRNDPMTGGYQLVPADQAEGHARQASLHELLLHMEQEFPTLETVDQVPFGGKSCYKVKMVDADGAEQYSFYNVDDKKVAGLEQVEQTPRGPMSSVVRFSDWKQFGDLNLFTKMTVDQGGMEFKLVVHEVEFNAVDASVFELPDAVKALTETEPPSTAPATQPE